MQYYSKFQVPNKSQRLQAIGPINNLPKTSIMYKILSTAENFHNPCPTPNENDWLFSHNEPGQTFSRFINSNYNKITPQRKTIYINPLQNMDQNFLNCLLYFCKAFFFPLNVELIKIQSLNSLKISNRINDYSNKIQYNASEILQKMKNYIPKNAYTLICILFDDLYPKPEWNFVYGLANSYDRIGVFSFARYDPTFFGEIAPSNLNELILFRSVRVMVHEICHMFGMSHCIFYHCIMNGSNHDEEALKRPVILCPVCLRKLQCVIGFDPLKRYQELEKVSGQFGGIFSGDNYWYKKRIASLLS